MANNGSPVSKAIISSNNNVVVRVMVRVIIMSY
jgi:hypothetical protein